MSVSIQSVDVTRRVSFDRETGTFRAVRKARQSGNSTIITIPPQLVEAAGFEEGCEVELIASLEDGEIVLRPVRDE